MIDFSGITTRRWLWPAIELGAVALGVAAQAARWREAIRDARRGHHGNHIVCRHGRAVRLDR